MKHLNTWMATSAIATMMLVVASQSVANEIEIGEAGPDFSAVGVDGKNVTLASVKDAKAVVVCFTCNGCPVAIAYQDRMIEFAKKYSDQGVELIAINCNSHTEDLEAMKQRATDAGFNFPYVFDASGDSARAYGARVTPHFFLLDGDRKVAYRGALDDDMTRPKTPHLANAVDAVLAGKSPEPTSTRAIGCGIKLKDKVK